MDLYSLTLGLALVAAGTAVVATVWLERARWSGKKTQPSVRTVARLCAFAGLALAPVATFVHVRDGHRPGTAQGMLPVEYLLEHPALGVLTVATLVLTWHYRSRY